MARGLPEALIWNYLAQPDPLAWLAAADWAEENQPEGWDRWRFCRKWRWRGTLFTPLYQAAKDAYYLKGSLRLAGGGFLFDYSLNLSETSLFVAVNYCFDDYTWLHRDYWCPTGRSGWKMVRKKVVGCIDQMAHNHFLHAEDRRRRGVAEHHQQIPDVRVVALRQTGPHPAQCGDGG